MTAPTLDSIASEAKLQSYIEKQESLDMSLRPSAKLYLSNPERYFEKWGQYKAETSRLVQALKHALNYFPSVLEEKIYLKDNSIGKGQHIGAGRIRIKSASDALSRTSQLLQRSKAGGFAPHFKDSLDKIKNENKKYADKLKAISTKDPIAYSISLGELYKQIPETVQKALQALPYRHVAADFLPLPKTMYQDLNETKPKRKKRAAKQANAPRVPLSAFIEFTNEVYKDRKQASWEDLMIALQLATGRRKNELGYLSTLAKTRSKGHLKIDIIAKKRPEAMQSAKGRGSKEIPNLLIMAEHKHPIPIVFYTPEQVLEMHAMLKKKLVRDLYNGDKNPLKLIKKKNDSVTFESDTGNQLRAAFQKHFPIQSPVSGEIGTYHIHNMCRSIYAQHAYQTFKDSKLYENKTSLSFANLALGHNELDLTTTTDYMAIILIDDTKKSKKPISHNLASGPLPKTKRVRKPTQTRAGFNDKDLFMEALDLAGKEKAPGILEAHFYLQQSKAPKYNELKKRAGSQMALNLYLELLKAKGITLDFLEAAQA
ncbi:MAG: hypothetical protein EOP04_03580 [Proteobacteria bacterium]|nr:MAG: hypothetical protein EOP04_03580 [Pseudomonadota bacterium]